MGVILRIVIGLAILAAIIFAIGLGLPRTHRAESRITLEKPPERSGRWFAIPPRWWEPGPC